MQALCFFLQISLPEQASFQSLWLVAIAMTATIVAHLHTRPSSCVLRSVCHGTPRRDHGLEGEAEVHQEG